MKKEGNSGKYGVRSAQYTYLTPSVNRRGEKTGEGHPKREARTEKTAGKKK